jgi:hypothetical protein
VEVKKRNAQFYDLNLTFFNGHFDEVPSDQHLNASSSLPDDWF